MSPISLWAENEKEKKRKGGMGWTDPSIKEILMEGLSPTDLAQFALNALIPSCIVLFSKLESFG